MKKFALSLLAALALALPSYAASPPTAGEKEYLNPPNELKNPGAELGSSNITISGGALSFTSGAGQTDQAFSWDASSSGQFFNLGVVSTAGTYYAGQVGRASCLFKTAATDYVLEVITGVGSTVIGTTVIPASSNFAPTEVMFPFPTTSTTSMRIRSQSNAAALVFDKCFFGRGIETRDLGGGLLLNPKWDATADGWTASGGTYLRTITSGEIGLKGSGSWDSSSASQTLTSNSFTIVSGEGVSSQPVVFSCKFKASSGTATHKIQIYDGTNVLVEQSIVSDTAKFVRSNTAIVSAPASGTISARVISVASNEPKLLIDDCFFGLAEGYAFSKTSQTILSGVATFPITASCSFTRTNTVLGPLFDSDCPGPTIEQSYEGSWQTTDANAPQITINSLPPGVYKVTASIPAIFLGATGNMGSVALNDGTDTKGTQGIDSGGGGDGFAVTVVGVFPYAQAGNRTFAIWGAADSGTFDIYMVGTHHKIQFTVEKFPLNPSDSYNFDTSNWRINAGITSSGATVDLSTSAISTPTGIEDGTMTMVLNQGSADAWIGCSSTNSPTGLTCSAGDESASVSFIPPWAGQFKVCAVTSGLIVGGANGSEFSLRVAETATNAQTIIQDTGERQFFSANGSAGRDPGFNARVCNTLSFSSTTRKMVRLFYTKPSSIGWPRIYLVSDASTSAAPMIWTVEPVDRQFPAPVVNNSVTSDYNGPATMRWAVVGGADAETACSSSPCAIFNQSGNWITSAIRNSTGDYTLTVTGFSAKPVCTCTAEVGNNTACSTSSTANTTVRLNMGLRGINNYDTATSVICVGPR